MGLAAGARSSLRRARIRCLRRVVGKPGYQGGELAPLRRSQWRKQFVLDCVDEGVEVAQLIDAFRGERDDVAALVLGVDRALDQVAQLEFPQCRRDIAAVDSGAAAQVGLARGTILVERREQPVVVAAKPVPMSLEAGVEQA